ncbi:unnamed protein product [Clonostachys rosea f. rosea IK726]|uniref:Uncharacterized protein n=1 Tax=Clonostachys rosea f. rosea IK726 TaxID=1349383 RepID=A0ACA9UJD7_BIOOC|nr:unnamed protein product [Clonostachys rosea f. rosea IK726]
MASLPRNGPSVKMNKTCDQCRHRKIRCIVPEAPPGTPPTCIYCAKRGQPCNFSIFRRKVRVKVPEALPAATQSHCKVALNDIFIDRVLQHGPQSITLADENRVFFISDEQVPSSGLAFFSEQKVASLEDKVGHTRLRALIEKLDDLVMNRLRQSNSPSSTWPSIQFKKPQKHEWLSADIAHSYIQAYFKNLHPLYPFLDREEFEIKTAVPNLTEVLAINPQFSALYHAILALGSQFLQGGTFEPGKGKSWELFQVSLGHMGDVLLPRESIENVQALTAMSIYAMNTCGLPVDDVLISHAARMVLTLRYHKHINSEDRQLRVFWVIYALEKQGACHSRIASLIADEDIGCMIPPFLEAQFDGYDWFIDFIRIQRITSIAYTSLFSVSASLRPDSSYQSTMDQVRRMLEEWRQSIPIEFRPGDSSHFPKSAPVSTRLAALQLHFSYYNIVIGLERLTLHLDQNGGYKSQLSKQRLMNTARTIIELTKYIEVQPYVPVFILAVLPVSALFILFDFVLHNPHHRESRTNLVLMDQVAGYFSLIGFASNQALPGTLMPEFSQIAREYYAKAQQELADQKAPSAHKAEEQPPQPPVVNQNSDQSQQKRELSIDPNLEPTSTPVDQLQDYNMHVGASPVDYLNYPTPMNFDGPSDFTMADSGDLRTIFGWVFPDWNMNGVEIESLSLDGLHEGSGPV